MAHAAGIVRLRAHGAMQARPVLAVTRRRRILVHGRVARGAVKPPAMGLLADLDLLPVCQRRNLTQLLVHERTVTIQAAVGQGGCVHKETGGLGGWRGRFLGRRQSLRCLPGMAFATGFGGDFLGFDPLLVTLLARRVRGSGETPIRHLPVAIRALHAVLRGMQVVAERERVAVILVAT